MSRMAVLFADKMESFIKCWLVIGAEHERHVTLACFFNLWTVGWGSGNCFSKENGAFVQMECFKFADGHT